LEQVPAALARAKRAMEAMVAMVKACGSQGQRTAASIVDRDSRASKVKAQSRFA